MVKKKNWSLRVPMHVSVPTTLITELENRAREEGSASFSGFVEAILRRGLLSYDEEREFLEKKRLEGDMERARKMIAGRPIA